MSEIRIHIIKAILKHGLHTQNNTNVIPLYKAEGEFDCNICLEKVKIGEDMRVLPCSETTNHKYHTKCIDTWLKNNDTCPTCRAKIF